MEENNHISEIVSTKCPILSEYVRGRNLKSSPGLEVLVGFTSHKSGKDPKYIICPKYEDSKCSCSKEKCIYSSSWKELKE